MAIFIFVLSKPCLASESFFFFGFFSVFVAGVGVGVGVGVGSGGGLRLMAPVAAANHDFNDFQHWLRLGCWSVNWPRSGWEGNTRRDSP